MAPQSSAQPSFAPSSIPFANNRNSADSNSLANQPHSSSATNSINSSPGKKKESILRKISISSRRSLAWLPGVHDHSSATAPQSHLPTTNNNTNNNNNIDTSTSTSTNHSKIKFHSTSNKSITPPNSDNPTIPHQPHSAKNVIGKSMRSVARTVKKSLHQFDRPRSITGDHLDKLPPSNPSHQSPVSPQQSSSRQPPGHRTRALSTPQAVNHQRSVPSKPTPHSLSGSPLVVSDQSSLPSQTDPTTPPRSPNRLKKSPKPRPLSTIETYPHSYPSHPDQSDSHSTSRLSWNAHTRIGSLPLAANILAAPSPPPVDDSSFLAIIPPPTTNSQTLNLPSLTLAPPPASQLIPPGLMTAVSVKVEPPQSRRVSPSSSVGPGPSNDDNNGFIFISSPSSQISSDPINQAAPLPSSPPPNPLLSTSWAEIITQSTCLETVKSRPPLVSTATAASLVQSCVAEHGSICELDLNQDHQPSSDHQVDAQITETLATQTSSTSADALRILKSSLEHDYLKPENRKRKVTNVKYIDPVSGQPIENDKQLDDEEIEQDESRHHKVLRSTDQPFSSSTSTALGLNHSTSHPLSVLTTGQKPLNSNHHHSNTHNLKNRKRSTRKKNTNSLSDQSDPEHHHDHHHDHHPHNEVWNFSIVSTVVGVVIIAVVLIGSTSFSNNLNGKSWFGNLIKKIS